MESAFANPIARRIQGGTVESHIDLCQSCRFCLRRTSAITGRTETRCEALASSPLVKTQIAQCNRYIEQGKLTLHEMVEVAWTVEARGKHIGFLSPEELERKRQRQPSSNPVGF